MSLRRGITVLLALLCALQLISLWRSPAVFSPSAIEVRLARGEAVTLGRQELAAPQAAAEHLALRRDHAGRWWARNVSGGRQVLLVRADGPRRMGSAILRTGQRFRVGAERFRVTHASARKLDFHGAGHAWSYDGALLLRDGSMLPACPGTGLATRALSLWNRIAPHALTAARAMAFGGNLHCGNRIGVAALAGGSAVLARGEEGIGIAHAGGSEAAAPVLVSAGQVDAALAGRQEQLAGVTALGLGRTRMALAIDADTLTLRPARQVALFTEQRIPLPPAVAWQWQQRATWAIPSGSAWSVAALMTALLFMAGARSFQRGRWPFERGAPASTPLAAGASALVAIAGVLAMLLQRAGAELGAGVSMLLGWVALWSFLRATRSPSLATCAGLLLLATGLLAQLELGLGAMDSSWLRHFQKTSALLAIGLGSGGFLVLRSASGLPVMPRSTVEWTLAGLAAAALAALCLQVVFGNETGVFDLQPVEFAKLALTALTAHCIAIGLGWHQAMPQPAHPVMRWLRLAGPALLLAALLGLALLQVDDYSPLILLTVWAMTMALAWALAARSTAAVALLAGVACLVAGSVAWMRITGADGGSDAGFYADRFAVWLDPARHPHTGQQMLLAARAVAEGAWWGADNWLGIGALGQGAGSALRIPAVQDDFAPAFFIYRHGLIGALLLWIMQALFVAGLLQTAARSYTASLAARDFRQAWRWRFRCFVLCGGAAFVAGHLLLSWGTNLAIFPIMGQPMSFLSAGGSHLLFFICPLLAFHAVSAQSFEEKASCRSMSNTRSWARFTTYSMPKASGRRLDWRSSRAARYCATCWNALRANFAGARRRAAFRM